MRNKMVGIGLFALGVLLASYGRYEKIHYYNEIKEQWGSDAALYIGYSPTFFWWTNFIILAGIIDAAVGVVLLARDPLQRTWNKWDRAYERFIQQNRAQHTHPN